MLMSNGEGQGRVTLVRMILKASVGINDLQISSFCSLQQFSY